VSDELTDDLLARWLAELQPSTEEHALYRGAAARTGLETAHWARQVLNQAAGSILDPEAQKKELASRTAELQALSREVARRGHELDQAIAQIRAKEELQRFLADATALLAESLDLGQTLSRVARLCIPVFADWCLLDLLGGDQRLQRVEVAHADPADAALARRIKDYHTDLQANAGYPGTRAMLGDDPVLIERFDGAAARAVAHDEGHLALIDATGARSVICAALTAHGKKLGLLTFMTAASQRLYTAGDLLVAQDIARRCALAIENARLFEEVRNALRIRDEFLSVASHELRTPLTPLQLQVDALERKFSQFVKSGKESWLEDRLTSIRRQTDRLEHLVEELPEMSQIVEGNIRLRPESVDLVGLIQAAVVRFRQDHPREEIVVDLPPDLVGRWDRERLGQVLASLLSNAQRYGGGQRILVRATRDRDTAVVAVSDRRAGAAPRDHRRASMAGQGPAATNYGGLGVGLFVTRQILEAMGGTIDTTSGPRPGATFTVRLPLDSSPPPTIDARPTATVH
jgi:signal transduction histidine kinase